MKTACCWCGGPFENLKGHYWCTSIPCKTRQAKYGVGGRELKTGKFVFLYVPLPKQVEYEECKARYLLAGGAAGTTKSHALRWRMYRRALKIPNYDGLLLRKTWGELDKHHIRLMEREAQVLRDHGIPVDFSATKREMRFPDGGVIEAGHLEDPKDIDKYLSRERDDICPDEGSTFDPQFLLELSTRARSMKPGVLADGGARFNIYTNPGGAAAVMLRDFFIDHTPDFDAFPQLAERDSEGRPMYDPADWAYIPGRLEDNPYLSPTYERDLAVLQPWRYRQLRFNDWDVMAGQFFTEFTATTHVKDLGTPSADAGWCGSLDWGYMNPGCFAWWVPLADGRLYRRFEYKFQHQTISAVKQAIHEIHNRFGLTQFGAMRLRFTAADPSLWQRGGEKGESIAETFSRPPNRVPLVPAPNDRNSGWQRCREWLQVRKDGDPWMVVHPDCRYFVRCVAAAVSDKTDPEDVDTHCEDHPLDEWRYFVMSRPSPLTPSKRKVYPKRSVGALFQEAQRKAMYA